MRLDHLIELLQDCLSVTGDSSDVLAKSDNTDDLQSYDSDSAILPAVDGAGRNMNGSGDVHSGCGSDNQAQHRGCGN
jgi:hypothetical protein